MSFQLSSPMIHRLKVSDGTHIGPHLLEDQLGREKIMHFDHERIPERVVHARGTGAYGYFKVYDDRASKYTYAPVLTDSTRKTPVFVRFSTVQGSRGSAVRFSLSISFNSHSILSRTPFEMFVALPPSFTLKKETGISLGMIFPFSSYKNQSSSLIWFMPLNPSLIMRFRKANLRTTIFGTSLVCSRNVK